MNPALLEFLRQIAGGIDAPKSVWMDELIEEIDRLNALVLGDTDLLNDMLLILAHPPTVPQNHICGPDSFCDSDCQAFHANVMIVNGLRRRVEMRRIQ